jgi:hypothetical protein
MHRSLLVKESLFTLHCKHTIVPDIRVDIQSARSIEPKAYELFGFSVIAREGQRYQKGAVVQGKEQLPSIGMVIAMP